MIIYFELSNTNKIIAYSYFENPNMLKAEITEDQYLFLKNNFGKCAFKKDENGKIELYYSDYTADEKNKLENLQQKTNFYQRIQELKQLLLKTDYKILKYNEGVLSEKEFIEIKTQRQLWRDEINSIEQKI